jgi:hypothetical protein
VFYLFAVPADPITMSGSASTTFSHERICEKNVFRQADQNLHDSNRWA